MKITIYTINDCKFSQAEKEYLKSKNLPFEEKNLETNREYLTEMLNISNNFAGTPVTKVEKDDGTSMVLKGFTQNEFDAALGFTTAPAETTTTPPLSTEKNPTDVKTEEPAKTDSPVVPPPSSGMDQPVTPVPDMSMNAPAQAPQSPQVPADMSAPAVGTPVSSSTTSNPPEDTSMKPADSSSMGVPSTPTGNPMASSNTTNDFMSAPQGEAIPNPAATEEAKSSEPAPDPMNLLKNGQPQQPANDPLSSVLNDLQTKGTTNS